MDIGFESNLWLQATTAQAFAHATGVEPSNAPEWLELRARLGAAWSARRELGLGQGGPAERCGSFDRASALALAGPLAHFDAASPAVNPIALGNLKSRWGNAGEHTEVTSPGGRG